MKQANEIVQPGNLVLKATVDLVDTTWLPDLASGTAHGPLVKVKTQTLVELMIDLQPLISAPEDLRIMHAQTILKLARLLAKEGDAKATAVHQLGEYLEAVLASEPSQSVRRSLTEAQDAMASLRSST